jgi:transcriptional regulator with XRE-family HTH domain
MEKKSAMQDCRPMKPPKIELLLSAEMNPERVGQRVIALRESLRLSKAQFADSIGLDRSALSRIERGAEGLGLIKATTIADLYGFGLNYIYRGDLSDVPEGMRPTLLVELHAARSGHKL